MLAIDRDVRISEWYCVIGERSDNSIEHASLFDRLSLNAEDSVSLIGDRPDT